MSVYNSPRIKLVRFQDYPVEIRAARQAAFIEELGIDHLLEWDQLDETAQYAIAIDDKLVVGIGRFTHSGKIGRMAVLAKWRKQGFGSRILQCLLQAAARSGRQQVKLSSQLAATGFYRKLGFKSEGEVFTATGIPHQDMVYHFENQPALL